jgi:hypothetical protein
VGVGVGACGVGVGAYGVGVGAYGVGVGAYGVGVGVRRQDGRASSLRKNSFTSGSGRGGGHTGEMGEGRRD